MSAPRPIRSAVRWHKFWAPPGRRRSAPHALGPSGSVPAWMPIERRVARRIASVAIPRKATRTASHDPNAKAVRQGCNCRKGGPIVLVLTRRENERILLPDVGVTVELMAVTGNRARLGISAPDNIRILREEVAVNPAVLKQATVRGSMSREFVQAFRNRLNAAILAAETVRMQIEADR